MTKTKIEAVTITETCRAGGNLLDPGTYNVQMPEDYDPELVTGEDILMDDALVIVDDEPTIASQISELLDGDGQQWETSDGRTLEQLCDEHSPTITHENRGIADAPVRYEFSDGSSIVTRGAAWDLGLPGGCFCWEGVGHEGCSIRRCTWVDGQTRCSAAAEESIGDDGACAEHLSDAAWRDRMDGLLA